MNTKMPAWSQITSDPKYATLGNKERAELAKAYFEEGIKRNPAIFNGLTEDQKQEATEDFFNKTAPASDSFWGYGDEIADMAYQGSKAGFAKLNRVTQEYPDRLQELPSRIRASELRTDQYGQRVLDDQLPLSERIKAAVDVPLSIANTAGLYVGGATDALTSGVANSLTVGVPNQIKNMMGIADSEIAEQNQLKEMQTRQAIEGYDKALQEAQPYMHPNATTRQAAVSGLGSAAELLPTAIAGAVSRNPVLLPTMDAIARSGASAYSEQRNAGQTPSEAYGPALLSGGAEAAMALPLGIAAGKLTKLVSEALGSVLGSGVQNATSNLLSTRIGRYAGGTLASGIEEVPVSLAQDAIRQQTIAPNMTAEEMLSNAGQSFIGGTAGGAVITAPGAYLSKNQEDPPTFAPESQSEVPEIVIPPANSEGLEKNSVDNTELPPPPSSPIPEVADPYTPSSEAVKSVLNSDAPVKDIVAEDRLKQQGYGRIDVAQFGEDGMPLVDNPDPDLVYFYNEDTGDITTLNRDALDAETLQPLDKESIQKVADTGREPATTQASLDKQRAVVEAESVTNIQPTEGQKQAGNYAKGKVKIMPGIEVSIENPKGSVRSGVSPDGNAWQVEMPVAYGYIKRTKGADGDHLDAFIGDSQSSEKVYVFDQIDLGTQKFDEQKVMIGFDSELDAIEAYDASFSDGRGEERIGSIKEMTKDDFRQWVKKAEYKKDYKTVQAQDAQREMQDFVPETVAINEAFTQQPEAVVDNESPVAQQASPETPQAQQQPFNPVETYLVNEQGVQPISQQPQQQAQAPSEPATYKGVNLPDPKGEDLKSLYRIRKKIEKAFVDASNDPSKMTDDQFSALEDYAQELEDVISQKQIGGESVFQKNQGQSVSQTQENDAPAETLGNVRDTEPSVAAPEQNYVISEDKKPTSTPSTLAQRIKNGADVSNILKARKLHEEVTGQKIEKDDPAIKQVDEDIETAFTMLAREIAADTSKTPRARYNALVDLYNRMPNLGVRTSTSKEMQAYSTPAPLAYLASNIVDVQSGNVILEPTAGNGSLLIEANPNTQYIIANELDAGRASRLRDILGDQATVTENDAVTMQLTESDKADRVIANPPFGKVFDEQAKKGKVFRVMGLETREIDQAIVMRSLMNMRDDGRAIFIIGSPTGGVSGDKSKWEGEYNTANSRAFFKKLYDNYNVVDHFIVNGKLYSRQGAGFNLDVIVIDGKGKSQLLLPGANVPAYYESWDALAEKLREGQTNENTQSMDAEGSSSPTIGKSSQRNPRRSDRAAISQPDTGSSGVANRDVAPRDSQRSVAEPINAELSAERQLENDTARNSGRNRDDAMDRDSTKQNAQSDTSNRDTRNDGRGRTRPDSAERGTRDEAGEVRSRTPLVEKANEFQAAYKPVAGGTAMGTFLPSNLAEPYTQSIKQFTEMLQQNGYDSIDDYVVTKLQYKDEQQLYDALGSEQIESVALAIHNIENNKGLIIGDQTGIGKGRQVASILRYARLSGRVPVFVSKDTGLFKDMYGDLEDVGEKDPKAFVAVDTAVGTEGTIITQKGQIIRALSSAPLKRAYAEMSDTGKMPKGYDYIFTTYSQLQPTSTTKVAERVYGIEGVLPNAIVVFDESHQGAGEDSKSKKSTLPDAYASRAAVVRLMVNKAQGVIFSSATYAKTPSTMAVYANKTDMAEAVTDVAKLPEIIKKGGVPLMQAVSSSLVRAGQMVRRERDFAGVSMSVQRVTANAKSAEAISALMMKIWDVDKKMQKLIKEKAEDMKKAGEAMGSDSATGDAGISSTTFGSLMHNLVAQSLVSLKLESTVSEIIAAHKRGEKVVVALNKTNGAILSDYAKDRGIKRGDKIENLDLRQIFLRYAERTREYNVKVAGEAKQQRRMITDAEMKHIGAYDMYQDAINSIKTMDIGTLPISPIDYLYYRLEQEGLKTREVTGRDERVIYSSENVMTFAEADTSKAARSKSMADFNSGAIDVIILNQAGSTG